MTPHLFLLLLAVQDTGQLSIVQTVESALATHPSVAAARALREHATAEVQEAVATRRPHLLLDAAVNQFEQPMIVAPLHRFDPRNPPLFDRTLTQSALQLNWTVFDFGSRAGSVRAHRALESAATQAISAAEFELADQVVRAYLAALSARERLTAEDQRLGVLEAESDRVRQRLAQGKAAQVEQLRANAEVQAARADRIATAARLNTAERQLAQLAGIPFARVHLARMPALRLADTSLAVDSLEQARAALVERARGANANVLELKERSRAAATGLAAIRATTLPELRLSGGYVDRGRWWGDYTAEWQVGLSLSYSLYGGGSQASAIGKAAADERAAIADLRLAEMAADHGVDEALGALREAHARAAALESAVDQSVEVARIERLALDVGSGTQTDYLAAEASLLRARASLIDARAAEISARVELARILGELTPAWLARTLETSS